MREPWGFWARTTMPARASKDIFGNPLDPFAASSWSQPAAILAPLLTESQLEHANFIVTALFVGVIIVVLRRLVGSPPLMEGLCRCCCGSSCRADR